jgi:hypothetical protein
MADRSWEEVEQGFTAVRWTMEALHGRLETLEKDGMSDHGEFGMAAEKTADLLRQLQDAINETGRLRQGGPTATKKRISAEQFHRYISIVPERLTWEEMLEHVAGEIPSGRVLLREAEPIAARAVNEMNSDAYSFLHFNPQMDLAVYHQLLVEERAAESFFPFASTGKMELKAVWHGVDASCTLPDYKPGEVRLTSADIVAMRRFRHFFDMIYCLEQLPSTITPSALNRLGFEVLRTRGPSIAPEGPVDSEGTQSRPGS